MAPFLVFLSFLAFFISFQSHGIYGGDAGDLVTAAYVAGVAHPPGFPLYTFLSHLLTKLPISTVAFRVGLLSSISAAATLTFIFMSIRLMSRNTIGALIAAITLGMTYLFWLYSIVPEVFMFNLFFMTALIFIALKWERTKNDSLIYLFSFVLGLSLSHHHIILFSLPAFFYFYLVNKAHFAKKNRIFWLKNGLLFALGLLPYIYIPIAAAAHPPINWNNVTSLGSFLKIITRADYGTFVAGPNSAQTPLSRFLQIVLIFEFVRIDMTIIGLFLMGTGAFALFKKNRRNFYFLLIGFLFVGPVYFFYAAYLATDEFSRATLERFLLPSYVFLILFLGVGASTIINVVRKRTRKKIYPLLSMLFLLLLPLYLFRLNSPRMLPLRHNMSAEEFARDVLSTAPQNAILVLQRDNTLFNVQYVYYTEKLRPDIKLFHTFRLFKGELSEYSHKYYPDIHIPKGKEADLIDAFVKANYPTHAILTNTPLGTTLPGAVWVRKGLLLELHTKDTLPTVPTLLDQNRTLWRGYHDPLKGALGTYRHLMLSNILDFYQEGHMETGALFEGAGKLDEALDHYKKAHILDENDAAPLQKIATIFLLQKKCEDARSFAIKSYENDTAQLSTLKLLTDISTTCPMSHAEATKWKTLYENAREKEELPLKEL